MIARLTHLHQLDHALADRVNERIADQVAQAVQEERERVAQHLQVVADGMHDGGIKRFATYMSKTLRRAPAGDA